MCSFLLLVYEWGWVLNVGHCETIFMLPRQVLRTFDKLISSSVTANMEQAGVKVTKRTQVSARMIVLVFVRVHQTKLQLIQ